MPEGQEHWAYIEAVVAAMKAAGLHVHEWEDTSDEHREACITLLTRPDADPEPDDADGFKRLRVAAWDERRGWLHALVRPGWELTAIWYLTEGQVITEPSRVAAAVFRIERTGEREGWALDPYWAPRDPDLDDPEFEAALAAYAKPDDGERVIVLGPVN